MTKVEKIIQMNPTLRIDRGACSVLKIPHNFISEEFLIPNKTKNPSKDLNDLKSFTPLFHYTSNTNLVPSDLGPRHAEFQKFETYYIEILHLDFLTDFVLHAQPRLWIPRE